MEKILAFEAFAGYGSQSMALELLKKDIGLDYKVVGISEIDANAIKAYYAARDPRLDTRDKAELQNLVGGGYTPPADLLADCPNYGDISKIDWSEVPDFNLFTYSFPCTDISNAGLQKGLAEGSGTRSSLLWECARAIEAKRPKYLLMENVKALVSDKFIPDLRKWVMYLETLGYANFYQVMNAKDYGVPQNRERVFMVSILGESIYYFPKPFKLDRRLKHVLEDNVDESFYLSDDKIQAVIDHCNRKQAEGCGFKTRFINPEEEKEKLTGAITGNYGQRETDTYLKEGNDNPHTICLNSKDENGKQPSIQNRVYDSNGVSTALTTCYNTCIAEEDKNENQESESV